MDKWYIVRSMHRYANAPDIPRNFKSVKKKTMSWLTQKNNSQYKAFGDYVNSTFDDTYDIAVNWCRMEKFTRGRSYSLAGWQAE